MQKIRMQSREDMTANEAFDKFYRIKKAKNLSSATLVHYQNYFRYFGENFDIALPCSSITSDVYYGICLLHKI